MIIFSVLMVVCHERNQRTRKAYPLFSTRNYQTLWVKLTNSLIELIQIYKEDNYYIILRICLNGKFDLLTNTKQADIIAYLIHSGE